MTSNLSNLHLSQTWIEPDPGVCAVCGSRNVGPVSGFLIAENPWEERVKILHWDSRLALSPGTLSACGLAHVRELLIQWASSEVLPPMTKNFSRRSRSAPADLYPSTGWELARSLCPIGELAVHRHAFHDSPATLRSVLDAVSYILQNESSLPPDGGADTQVFSCILEKPEIGNLARSASA